VTDIAVTIVDDDATKDVQLRIGADSDGGAVYDALASSFGAEAKAIDLVVERTGASISRRAPASDAGLRWGDRILVRPTSGSATAAAPYGLVAVRGPLVGCRRPLPQGMTELGRSGWPAGRTDQAMSRSQASIEVQGSSVAITDLGSTNGTEVNGVLISARTALHPGDHLLVGDSEFLVTTTGTTDGRSHLSYVDGSLGFGRSVEVVPPPPAVSVTLPTPPAEPAARRFPVGSAAIPIVLGGVIYFVTRQPLILLFMALGPVMLVWSAIDDRRSGRRDFRNAKAAFEADLAAREAELGQASADAARWRHQSLRSPEDLVAAAVAHDPSVWSRHPRRSDFLDCRVGVADLPSLVTVKLPATGSTELRDVADAVAAEHSVDRGVPVLLPLRSVGSVGIHGDVASVHAAATALVGELAVLHSPRYLSLVVIAPESGERWGWTKWLPHVNGLLDGARTVAADHEEATQLWDALEKLVERRREETEGIVMGSRPSFTPHVVVVLEPPLRVTPRKLSVFLETAVAVGISVVWVGSEKDLVPPECHSLLDAGARTGSLAVVADGLTVTGVAVDALDAHAAEALGRSLAPLVDTTAEGSDGKVPASVSLLDLLEAPDLSSDSVLEWWSAPAKGLEALVGADGSGPVEIDLRADGPHGLVAGSTGAGKSEFLQSLVAALALRHPPERITFILVDYKGGAAFKDCVAFPHTVGFVTDLDLRRTVRAQVSLNAELKRREGLLERADAKDLDDMVEKDPEHAPPALLIVVDEYAALKDEVPDFVDTVVDVARRGRSLGVHLILATQTPEGVISKDIERNSDLRVALRLKSASESDQLIGTRAAVDIPKQYPGRALLRSGASGLKPFQSAYVGGLSVQRGPDPSAAAQTFRFGAKEQSLIHQLAASGPGGMTDLKRIALAQVEAFARRGSPEPFRPWPDELSPVIPLTSLPVAHGSGDSLAVAMGTGERLEQQTQEPYVVDFGRHSSYAVYGSPGAGATTFLRTLGVALATTRAPSHVHLYAIDGGGGGLRPLAALPHCGSVVSVDDTDRLRALLATLAEEASARAELLAGSGAGSLDEHRRRTGDAPPPIVLLVDRFSALWDAIENIDRSEHATAFARLVTDGRGVGIHVVLTADRRGALPQNIHTAIGARVVLRLSSVEEYGQLDLPQVKQSDDLPPGRGFLPGAREVQVAVVSATPDEVDGTAQAAEIERIGAELRAQVDDPSVLPAAVGALAEDISWDGLAVTPADGTVIGLGGVGSRPVRIDLDSNPVFLVAGPEDGGRSQALATIVRSLERQGAVSERVLIAGRRTPILRSLGGWAEEAIGLDAATACLAQIAAEVSDVAPDLDEAEDGAGSPRRLIVIDDADEMVEGAVANSLNTLVRRARDAGCIVVVSMLSSRAIRSYSEWVAYTKTNRHGLLLQPDVNTDGDVFRVDLPKRANLALPVGRGYLVTRSAMTLVHVAQ
jgi:S-DNA-T family DNA segregation ATPase FtsK/SpoIIIE